MYEIKVSLIAAAIRTQLWDDFMKSLKSTTVSYEVIFSGHCSEEEVKPYLDKYPELKYIHTKKIKPAQCYQVSLIHARGETISWVADDCEFTEDLYGKAYRYWKSLDNKKVCLSVQTVEDNYRYNLKDHAYCGFNRETPMMMPVNLMSRKYLEELGGFDRRFQCGQYENESACRVYADGGCILQFTDGECIIDHGKHDKEHRFRIGYSQDRKVLEASWGRYGEAIKTGRLDKFEPYEDKSLLTKSQCLTLKSIWI